MTIAPPAAPIRTAAEHRAAAHDADRRALYASTPTASRELRSIAQHHRLRALLCAYEIPHD